MMRRSAAAAALAMLLTAAGPANFEARILAAHNAQRSRYGVPPLAWDGALAADAVAWGKTLAAERRWEHDPDNRSEGENLWMGTSGAFSIEQMVGSWADERRFWREGVFPDVSTSGSWHDIGHWTQMVWRGTSAVGCGLVRGDGDDYLVCRYGPPGNVIGRRVF